MSNVRVHYFEGRSPLSMILAQIGILSSGFMAYQLAAIVANAVAKAVLGHGLRFAVNSTIMKTISIFAGPIGWFISGLWTVIDLAGPAYRSTIPLVCIIASLRLKYTLNEEELGEEVEWAFNVLGIASNSSWEEVKIAYRNKVKIYHPDKFHREDENKREKAHNIIIELNRALDVLNYYFNKEEE